MHIVKFDHGLVSKSQSSAQLTSDRVASRAETRPALYGHRRQFLQRGLSFGLALALSGLILPGRPRASAPIKIVAFGDSLSAGYRLPEAEAFPAVLEKALRADGFDVSVVNAGVSGDTTADGLARFDWTFAEGADAAILELGANDMLRGLDPKLTRETLDELLAKFKARKIPVFIAGMLASPSFGEEYQQAFDPIYPELAHKYDAPLYPFFLQDVMNVPTLQLADGLHPNREGVEKIVQNMLPDLERFIKTLSGRS
jgi:acyl-CoA thioesterase-1